MTKEEVSGFIRWNTKGPICDFNMDFDYQQIKDSEMRQREERIASPPVPQSEQPPARQIPPIKPRRSLKSRATPKEEAGPPGQLTNGREGEVKKEAVVQKVSPAVLWCGGPGPLEALSPSLRAHTLLWFERSQLPQLHRPGQPLPCWLHGFATRREAEELLKDEPEGCFLVRLSESKIGFVLSYRGRDRCRHFILEEEEGRATGGGRHYLIAGEESHHDSLQELINYYTQHAVGPFDEVLTVPCVKGKRGSEDLAGQGVGGTGLGGALGAGQEPSAVPPALQKPESTPAPATPPPKTAQYAVVRKLMRKANSLPDRQTDEETEVPNFIPAAPPKVTAPLESDHDRAEPGDPQYARVNKPPRALASTAHRSSSPSSSSSDTHPDPQGGVVLPPRGSVEEKYWELVPMHTYEETHHLTHPQESCGHINFNAVGQREDGQRTEEGVQTHVYSEVNLRGLRDGPPTLPLHPPARTAPGLPLRPPPRLTDCPVHLDPALQRLDGRLPLTPPPQPGASPSLTNSHSPIYEQIPEGGLSARPPLPPQNHKH